jgi:hypothetical protein
VDFWPLIEDALQEASNIRGIVAIDTPFFGLDLTTILNPIQKAVSSSSGWSLLGAGMAVAAGIALGASIRNSNLDLRKR